MLKSVFRNSRPADFIILLGAAVNIAVVLGFLALYLFS